MEKLRISAAAAAAVAVSAILAGCEKKPELHIYTWSDYIAPEIIEQFEEENSCRVVVDTFDSNETMYAKLKAGGTGYDIIMPSSYLVELMAREGLVRELDHSKMPNVKANFSKAFLPQILDPSFKYNVPYSVTYTGFCYAKDKIPAGVDVETWKVLENPSFKSKITLLDDIREVIGAGLMSIGCSINSTDPAEIDRAVAEVLKWKQNIRKFDAESYKTEVPSGATWIGHGYSSDATQVILGDEEEGIPARKDIGFALPREGFSIAFDEMVVSSTAPNPELAYKFMDFVYRPEVAKEDMEYIMSPVPVQGAIDELDEDIKRLIILTPEQVARGQVLAPIKDLELYNRAWDRIKATEAR